MRGNGINVLRIAPYSAVQFSSYELVKGIMISLGAQIDTPHRLFAGSLAGIASVVSTYPLDLVRSRFVSLHHILGTADRLSLCRLSIEASFLRFSILTYLDLTTSGRSPQN
jgi:solute carrier family 25 phosphate transporter 23/24/25/41